MPICPARRDGFDASNRSRTSCQVSAFWANPFFAKTIAIKSKTDRRRKKRLMKSPTFRITDSTPAFVRTRSDCCCDVKRRNVIAFIGEAPSIRQSNLRESIGPLICNRLF
jgi:hypothetical protein